MSDGKTYFYETEAEWTGAKDLKLSGAKQPAIAAGAPPEFQGREENWSPEHLFVASLNSCYVLTLIAIAEFSKVALVSCSSTAKESWRKCRGAVIRSPRSSSSRRWSLRRPAISRACREFWQKLKIIALYPTRSKRQLGSSPKSFISRRRYLPAHCENLQTDAFAGQLTNGFRQYLHHRRSLCFTSCSSRTNQTKHN